MAEASEIPPDNYNNNSNLVTTIQPAIKLGGRGTPRRKTRRSSNTNHSALVAARTIENKLKPFRTQYQLYDQQELFDVTILYEDGHIDTQNQVHIHSTRSMTIHEIDSSETGTQTYHINDLDSTTSAYLLGKTDHFSNEINGQTISSLPILTSSTNYYNDIRQRQLYTQSSPYYMNASNYQQTPYAYNSFDAYSKNIQEVYGGVNEQSDDEEEKDDIISTVTKSKRRRKRKPRKSTSGPSILTVSSQIKQREDDDDDDDDAHGNDDVQDIESVTEQPVEHLENDNIIATKTKRKRRRIRKPKKSSTTGEQVPSSTMVEQSNTNALDSLPDEKSQSEHITSQSSTPSTPAIQHHIPPHSTYFELEKNQPSISSGNDMHENKNNFSHEDVLNVLKNVEEKKEIDTTNFLSRTTDIPVNSSTPTISIPTKSIITGVVKNEDENNQINNSITSTTFRNTTNLPIIVINDDDDEISNKQNDLDQKANSTCISNRIKSPLSTINFDMDSKDNDPSSLQNFTQSTNSISSNDNIENSTTTTTTTTPHETFIGDILSTDGKYASVRFHDEPRRHTISHFTPSTIHNSSRKQSKTNLNNVTSDLNTQLESNDSDKSIIKQLNPDAPDFKPTDFTSSYHSELAPAHLQRRATHGDFQYDGRNRTRNHSDTLHHGESLTTIRPLLSIVPQYTPYHRKSWSTTTSNSLWQSELNHSTSPNSKSVTQIYAPLMPQPLLPDENNFLHKQPTKRPRAYSGRAVMSSLNPPTYTRQRSQSGPEPSIQPPSSHLTGIHSLTRIMVDLLRLIKPIVEEQSQQQDKETILVTNSTLDSSYEHKDQKYPQDEKQLGKVGTRENVVIAEDKCTTPSSSSLLLLSSDKAADVTSEDENSSTNFNTNEPKLTLSLISIERKNENNLTSTFDVPSYQNSENDETTRATTESVLLGTPDARAAN
ncbi:hypothetical protein I4U23_007716 [Adineta vaga]|nr:hypothetical protein I4U23_007716 [Adineta vaga]